MTDTFTARNHGVTDTFTARNHGVTDTFTRRTRWAALLLAAASLTLGLQPVLAVLTALAFGAALAGLVMPAVGFVGVGLLCVLDPVVRDQLFRGTPLPWNLINYFLLVVVALSIPRLLRRRDSPGRLLEVLLLVLAAGLAWSLDRRLGLLHILMALIYFGILHYLLPLATSGEAWYRLGLVNGTVAAVGSGVYFLQRQSLASIDANALSHFPLTGLLSCALAYRFSRAAGSRARMLERLAAANACWIFLSGSRGGLLVALFVMGWLLVQAPGRRARLALLGWTLLLGGVIVLAFHSEVNLERSTAARYSLSQRTSGRSELAAAAWGLGLAHPFGIGTGSFPKTWAYRTSDPAWRGRYSPGLEKDAHSAWLKVFAENGFPGALALLAFVGSFAAVGWRRRRRDPDALALGVLASGAMALAFVTTQFQPKGIWLLAAGVAAVLDRAGRPGP